MHSTCIGNQQLFNQNHDYGGVAKVTKTTMDHQNYSKVVIPTKDLTQDGALLLLVKPLQDFATITVVLLCFPVLSISQPREYYRPEIDLVRWRCIV